MTQMTITRSRDILLYIGKEMLFGVTKLRVQSRFAHHEIMEYLSAAPWASVPDGEKHEIELKVLSLFHTAIPREGSFTLRVADDGTEYIYEDCVVTHHERNIRGDKTVTDSYRIESHHMTKRRIGDAG